MARNVIGGSGVKRTAANAAVPRTPQRAAPRWPAVAPDEVFSAVLRLVRMVQTGMQNIENDQGLSGSQLWALWQVSAEPGQRVSELAKALHIHPSTASNLIDKLEMRGYVRRQRGGEDNRVVRLHLADAGIRLVKNIPGPMQGRMRHALQDVPPEVLAGLHRGVAVLLGLMEAHAEPVATMPAPLPMSARERRRG